MVKQPDDDEAIILESLESELEAFFCYPLVGFMTEEEAEKVKAPWLLMTDKLYHRVG